MFKNKTKKRNIVRLCFLLLCCVCFASVPANAMASDGQWSGNPVYIAGNPSFYPYEYYDADTGTYEGVFPKIYALIHEETGLNFEYVNPGESDERLADAKTSKADIVSAYVYDEEEVANYHLRNSIPIVQYTVDGKTVDVCIIFSRYADAETVEIVKEGASTISSKTVSSLIAETLNKKKVDKQRVFIFLVIALLFLALVASVVVLLARVHRMRSEDEQRKNSRFIDPLTKLGNKLWFRQEFDRLASSKYKNTYAIAYAGFDIARVNQQFGEEAAENQMRFAADILSAKKKDRDITARIAGGAFGIIHACAAESEVREWGRQIADRLNVYIDHSEIQGLPRFRCGIYHIPALKWNFNLVLKNAIRCYDIAVQKEEDFFVYSTEMEQQDLNNDILIHDVADSMKQHQMKQYLQPIMDLRTTTVAGAEGLARWDHPKMGLLSPGRFVHLMINEGTIIQLDMLMFEEACKQLEHWEKSGKNYFLSTNFTRVSLTSKDFTTRVRVVASHYYFTRSRLIVEVTGDSLAEDRDLALRNMKVLKSLGFTVALDNVGSKYTLFSDLKYFPLDIVKLDRDVLRGAVDERGKKLMRGIVQLCKNIGLVVLCEGIENRSQCEMVKEMGCEFAQGYYFSAALSPADAEKIM